MTAERLVFLEPPPFSALLTYSTYRETVWIKDITLEENVVSPGIFQVSGDSIEAISRNIIRGVFWSRIDTLFYDSEFTLQIQLDDYRVMLIKSCYSRESFLKAKEDSRLKLIPFVGGTIERKEIGVPLELIPTPSSLEFIDRPEPLLLGSTRKRKRTDKVLAQMEKKRKDAE